MYVADSDRFAAKKVRVCHQLAEDQTAAASIFAMTMMPAVGKYCREGFEAFIELFPAFVADKAGTRRLMRTPLHIRRNAENRIIAAPAPA